MLRFRRPDSVTSLALRTPEKEGSSSPGGTHTPESRSTEATPSRSAAVAALAPPLPSSSPRVEVIDYVTAAARRHGQRNRSIADAVALFHVAAFAYHTTVWGWHWSPAAAALPGATGFGWFFRYLTFYSYTLQTAAFGLSAASALAGTPPFSAAAPSSPKRRAALRRAADDASCAVFGLANVVSVMYYSLEAATSAVVEGGPVVRPPWLGRSVHALNAVAAWVDLLVAHPRSFSPRAAALSHAAAGAYSLWLLVVRLASGSFPYPILNALPMPWGYLGLTTTALALFAGLFALGRRLSTPLLRVKAKAGWPQE